MNPRDLPQTTTILEFAEPMQFVRRADTCVLGIHGWKGWTGRMSYFAERLHEAGFDVVMPRLPGHGTSVADMRRSSARDWIVAAVNAYIDLTNQYERVLLAGHSMGAIIAQIIAAQYGTEKLVLLAPAHKVRNKLLPLTPILRPFLPRRRSSWRPEMEDDPRDRAIAEEYAYWDYLSLAVELTKVQRIGRRLLPSLTSETFIAVSHSDEAVPVTVADYIRAKSPGAKIETLVVQNSNHQVPQHVDRQEVADAAVAFCTRP